MGQEEYNQHIANMEEQQSRQLQELEAGFSRKMAVEVGMYQKLVATREKEELIWEATMKEVLETHSKRSETETKSFESARGADAAARAQILEDKQEEERVHRETLQQLEQDADQEIEGLKDFYETQLSQERDDKVRLRGQAGLHRKHHEDLKRQLAKRDEDLRLHIEEARKRQDRIETLVKEREFNLKEIAERDRMITEKEQMIYNLKMKNVDLEKFRHILDYKIIELRAQIDPKNEDLASMSRDVAGMDTDLEEYHRKNKLLQQDITSLQAKHRGLQEESSSQRRKLTASKQVLLRFSQDLSDVGKLAEDVTFKDALSAFHKKYQDVDELALTAGSNASAKGITDANAAAAASSGGSTAARDATRETEYLEKTIESLKRSLRKDAETHRLGNMRIMSEQTSLLSEINELRKELSFLSRKEEGKRLLAEAEAPAAIGDAGGGEGPAAEDEKK